MSGAATGLLAAVLASAGYGSASVLQAVGARRAAAAGATSGVAVARDPAYLAGVGLDGAAWLVSLLALRVLPLFVVQALLAGSLAVTAVAGQRVLGLRLRRVEGVAVAAVVAALAVLAVGAQPGRPRPAPPGTGVGVLALGAVLLVLAVLPGRRRAPRVVGRTGSAALAAAAGLAYTGAALCVRLLHAGPPAALVAQPAAWAVLPCGAAGTVLYARSLAGDGVVVATALLWGVEVVAGGALGVLLLGDGVRPGWAPASAAGVAVVLAACAVLARPAAAAGGDTM